MRAHRIVAGGSCQFRAVVLATTGNQSFHAEFCQAAVEGVTGANADHYLPFMNENTSVRAWREKMATMGSDGDHLTFHALAQKVARGTHCRMA